MIRRTLLGMLFAAGILLLGTGIMLAVAAPAAAAAPLTAVQQAATPTAAQPDATPTSEPTPEPSNSYCLLCHSQPGLTETFLSGETMSLTVDPSILAGSVHGTSNSHGELNCTDCHGDYRYPHPALNVETKRQFDLQRYATCRNCHEDEYTKAQDSVHGEALRNGDIQAATCVDCHGGHDIQPPDQPRQRISLTCGQCHGAIFDEYRTSVHGAALLEDSNPDVPTCIDCHGVHNISNPTTALFRVRSPELCATCHANDALMSKYNISTNVFNSYLTDFHGSTVALFEQEDPNVPTNKAVCYDCHGVHNIQPVTSANNSAVRQNLLATCRKCHPNATADFPGAWVGHFPPTADNHPLLYTVNLFYTILIPAVVGGFLLLIGTDIFRIIRARFFRSRN